MTRPKYCRKIECRPGAEYFKPRGIPSSFLEEIVINLDEFEALRLADYEGLYHEQCAAMMNISRQTFGRIVVAARNKIADALVNGKALKIGGGTVSIHQNGEIECHNCRHVTDICPDTGDVQCPRCIKKIDSEKLKDV
jgi:uncharacterized protein